MKNKGFTLLELLVVVLIIGILAAIALPQYRKAVEKAKLSEALTNFHVLKNAMDRYMLQNTCPASEIYYPDIQLDIELSDGEWNDDTLEYVTKNFRYSPSCSLEDYFISIHYNHIQGDVYDYSLYYESDGPDQICATNFTDIGKYICKYLESQGWTYQEGEY